jgi:menaquinone-dependent protoporphyrinogen IX oxidase
MKKKFLVAFIMSILVGMLVAEPAGPKKRVLITSSKSDYKKDLIAQMEFELKELHCDVVRESNKFLKTANPLEYDAIVVLNAVHAGKQEKKVRKFLASISEKAKEKVLIVNTVGAKKYVKKQPNVPLITSASDNSKAEETAREIMNWLRDRLK